MKSLCLFSLLSLFSLGFQAQALFRGNLSTTAYLGYPNILRLGMEVNENIPMNVDVDYGGIAPSGIRMTYMLGDVLGIGLDLIYTQASARYTVHDSSFFNNTWNHTKNEYFIQKKRFRPQVRFDFHLGSDNPNFDSYFGVAVGGNMRSRQYFFNDSLVSDSPNELDIVIPVSLRLCYGFQYFFNYNLAVSTELGLGGPLLQAGITYRF